VTPRQRYLAARWAYVGVVLLATLTQLEFSPDLAAAAQRLARAFTPSLAWRDAIDGLRNLALFAGLGAVWVVTSLTGKVTQEIPRATLVGLALSATVEGLQTFSPVRNASLVDVTTNTLGALAGAVAVTLLIAQVQRAKGARSYLGMPAFLFAGAYALAVACEALTPLFNSRPLSGLEGGPLTRLHVLLQLAHPLSLGEVPLLDMLLFAPAGFLVVLMLGEHGSPGGGKRAWPLVAAVGVGFAVAAELTHGLVGIPLRWEAAAARALALGAGAWAAHRWLGPLTQTLRGVERARATHAALAVLLVLWGWRPFLPQVDGNAIAAQLTTVHLVPLASLSERVDLFSALHVGQQFLLYLPLGAFLAVWPLRLSGRWAHLRPALWLAAVIEVGHLFIIDRYFDVTNALIACAGLGIGWVVVRRSGFAPYGEALPISKGGVA
jgi:glycopeptide antibiotics resistance protein